MALNIPTFSNLMNRICTSINANVRKANAFVARSFFNVLAKIIAQLHLDIYQHINALAVDYFLSTASLAGLIKRGNDMGVPRKLASFAAGYVVFTGRVGTWIPSGTLMMAAAGQHYKTDFDIQISADGQAIVKITAQASGTDGNVSAGYEITLVSPIDGITSTLRVDAAGIIGGANIEDTESYRARLLKFIQDQPGAGDPSFYEHMALSQPGVTRAKCIRVIHGAGTVGLLFMMDNTYPDGVPQAGDITAMHDFVSASMPADVNELFVSAPTLVPVDVTISDLNPDTIEMRNTIQTQLSEYFKSILFGGTMYVSQIEGLITGIPGEISHNLDAPVTNKSVANNTVFTLGVLTFSKSEVNG